MIEQPTKTPASRQPTGLIVALVVLILAVAGGTGWFVVRPMLAGSPVNNGGTTAPVSPGGTGWGPASPKTVPFDPTAGLDVINCCQILGVWSDIAVLVAQVKGPSGDGNGPDVLRGVDVTTGNVLWTYAKDPDGGAFSVGKAMVSGDRLAVGLFSYGGGLSPDFPGDFVVILSLAKGDVLGNRFFPVTQSLSGPSPRTIFTHLAAYVDGVVVVDQYDEADWVMTQAYQDTNLQALLWQAAAVEHPGAEEPDGTYTRSWDGLDPVLGPLVLTASWDFNDVHTGKPSHLSLFDGNRFRAYSVVNGLVMDVGLMGDRGSGAISLRAWDDPMAATPKWTYTLPDGWVVQLFPIVGCYTSEALIVQTRLADGSQGSLVAIRFADGKAAWSVPYNNESSQCVVLSQGDKEYVAVANTSSVDFFDGGNGSAVGKYEFPDAAGSMPRVHLTGIELCGGGLVCVLLNTVDTFPDIQFIATALDFKSGVVSSPWTQTATVYGDRQWAYRTDAGLVVMTQPSIGVYEWLIV